MVAITLTPKIKNIDKLLAHCHRRRYTAKSTIIYAGDRCESLFFIVKGSVTILIEDDDGREMIIAYLNAGDFFGEMGLFEKEGAEKERSAWVRAKTECEVAELNLNERGIGNSRRAGEQAAAAAMLQSLKTRDKA